MGNFLHFGKFSNFLIWNFLEISHTEIFKKICDFGNFWKFAIFWEIFYVTGNLVLSSWKSDRVVLHLPFPPPLPPLPRPGRRFGISATRDKSFWRWWRWRWRWSYMLLGPSEYYSRSKMPDHILRFQNAFIVNTYYSVISFALVFSKPIVTSEKVQRGIIYCSIHICLHKYYIYKEK